jgi:hypothetical protein
MSNSAVINTPRNGTCRLTIQIFTEEVIRHMLYKSCEWAMPDGCHCSLRAVNGDLGQWTLKVSKPMPGVTICAGKVTDMGFAKAEKLIGWALRTGKLITYRSQ